MIYKILLSMNRSKVNLILLLETVGKMQQLIENGPDIQFTLKIVSKDGG